MKFTLANELEIAKAALHEESEQKTNYASQLNQVQVGKMGKNIVLNKYCVQNELEALHEQYDEEVESKTDLMRQLSKANGDVQQWKARYEQEGLVKIDEIEEAK
jgi:hypothetical protein